MSAPVIILGVTGSIAAYKAADLASLLVKGGAEVHVQASLTRERIAELLTGFMNDPAKLTAMAAAAKSAGKPDAARLLADLTEAIASRKTVSEFRKGTHA